MKLLSKFVLLTAVILLAACANLSPDYEQPDIHLTKVQLLPSQGLEQQFAIGLRIQNPNAVGLNITGLSYSLRLQDHKVVSGVSSNGVNIPAYSETVIDLTASTSLLGGLRALSTLLQNPNSMDYEFEVKLKTGFWPWPVSIVESGSIALE